ncbi:MAG: hypothetical protein FWC97_09605 [Treponema sp.]|nr:hypothetical protein [Treponema sp.]
MASCQLLKGGIVERDIITDFLYMLSLRIDYFLISYHLVVMYRDLSSVSFILPAEYQKTAESLFPGNGFPNGQAPNLKAAADFAKILGIGVEYQRLLALEKESGELKKFLDHFQNNMDLLIKKTWVDKSDEKRKYKLQDKVPLFMKTIEQGDYLKSIEEFSTILDDLAYLLFGAQSEKEDFTEYTFRIDEQMGLFWWYESRLMLFKELKEQQVLWAVLLLGLCYLTNF